MKFGRTLIVAATVVVYGCQSTPQTPDEAVRNATEKDTERLHTDLVRQMIQQQKYYAASAHLDALASEHGETDEIVLLRADCQRHLGHRERSAALYRKVMDGPYAASAAHGMGLLLAETDLNSAIDYLQRAARLQPTDARIRNDLGYAMMLSGQLDAAHQQLSTAAELAPENTRPRHNLVLLYYLAGDPAQARRTADQGGIDASERERLQQQAAAFHDRPAPGR